MAETHFCDQTLEPKAMLGLGAGFAEIIVDDLDAFARPSQTESPINQPILQLGAFLMMSDLANARLANIDIASFARWTVLIRSSAGSALSIGVTRVLRLRA
jgi:hypothetical protein